MKFVFYLIFNYYNLILYFSFIILYEYSVESLNINGRPLFITNYRIIDNLPNNLRNKQYNRYKILKSNEEYTSEISVLPEETSKGSSSKITITNNQNEFEINERLLLETSKLYISKLGLDDFMLDIFIEDENNMKNINKVELGKDEPTDIISLREDIMYTKSEYIKNKSSLRDPKQYHLGEIFLCPKYIKQMAEKEILNDTKSPEDIIKSLYEGGVAIRMEGIQDVNTRMCFLLAHGILHLIGYDHVKEEDFKEMVKMENILLDEYMNNLLEKYMENVYNNDNIENKYNNIRDMSDINPEVNEE